MSWRLQTYVLGRLWPRGDSMIWLLAGVFVLWVAIVSPTLRRVLAALVGVTITGALLLLGWLNHQERRRGTESEAAKQRIPITRIDLRDMRMGTGGPSVTLTGRVRNNDSVHTLTGLELRLQVFDCSPNVAGPAASTRQSSAEPICDTVGDAMQAISINVPPGQARDFDQYVRFRDLRAPNMKRTWTYELLSISGQAPTSH
jgi:hypothetical protein